MREGELLTIVKPGFGAEFLRPAQDSGSHGIALFVSAGSRQRLTFRRLLILLELDGKPLSRSCARDDNSTIWSNSQLNSLHDRDPRCGSARVRSVRWLVIQLVSAGLLITNANPIGEGTGYGCGPP